MLAYMCKYVPSEVFASMGTPMILMEPNVTNFTQADTLMHGNMCSYIKAVLEEFTSHDFEGMIFTSCCDSARRLYDVLVAEYPDKFFYRLDLPRKINNYTISLYKKQMEEMIQSYCAFSGKSFSPEKLADLCQHEVEMQTVHKKALKAAQQPTISSTPPLQICLAGARPGSKIKHLIQDHNCEIVLDLTCTGIERIYQVDRSDILSSYTESLLTQIPCMRMQQTADRDLALREHHDQIDGIIYHTIKFCDIYSYEYAKIKDTCDLPMVKLETDATAQCAGQILTRVEAFLESLKPRCRACYQGEIPQPRLSPADVALDEHASGQNTIFKGKKPMYVMGIDSGSTSTNAVIMNEKKEIVSFAVVRTGAKSGESANRILEEILQKANLNKEDISEIISTGYGRVSIPFADRNVTEISCHGKGAHYLNPQIRTILDIGGQDSKAIRLDQNGSVIDFVMNDKCAAGTGRFLEMMARTLEIDITELGPISLESTEKIEISSMCSVFAESEVISLIAQNKEKADIVKGIHTAIAGKAISLMKRVGMEPGYMMTGGVAKNPGMVKVLEEQLGTSLYIYEEPEIVGAIGAALYGFE